jgi:hypothetical protein
MPQEGQAHPTFIQPLLYPTVRISSTSFASKVAVLGRELPFYESAIRCPIQLHNRTPWFSLVRPREEVGRVKHRSCSGLQQVPQVMHLLPSSFVPICPCTSLLVA